VLSWMCNNKLVFLCSQRKINSAIASITALVGENPQRGAFWWLVRVFEGHCPVDHRCRSVPKFFFFVMLSLLSLLGSALIVSTVLPLALIYGNSTTTQQSSALQPQQKNGLALPSISLSTAQNCYSKKQESIFPQSSSFYLYSSPPDKKSRSIPKKKDRDGTDEVLTL